MEQPPNPLFERVIFVCCNEREQGEAACATRGSGELHKQLKTYMQSKNLQDRCRVARSLCLGPCAKGPNICVMPENVWYHGVSGADLEEIQTEWIDSLAPKPD